MITKNSTKLNSNLKSKLIIGSILATSVLSIASFGGKGNNNQQNIAPVIQNQIVNDKAKSELLELEQKKIELIKSQKIEKENNDKLKLENDKIQRENEVLKQKEADLKLQNEKALEAKVYTKKETPQPVKPVSNGSFGYCVDGTTTNSKGKSGACSHHGGLAR